MGRGYLDVYSDIHKSSFFKENSYYMSVAIRVQFNFANNNIFMNYTTFTSVNAVKNHCQARSIHIEYLRHQNYVKFLPSLPPKYDARVICFRYHFKDKHLVFNSILFSGRWKALICICWAILILSQLFSRCVMIRHVCSCDVRSCDSWRAHPVCRTLGICSSWSTCCRTCLEFL